MTAQPEITLRDLGNRSKEIMDAVQGVQSFTVTRGEHRIGELVPLRKRRRCVPAPGGRSGVGIKGSGRTIKPPRTVRTRLNA
jgi:antitoxin (DNA-binding transcriptional repressor) of toxin-antitoxin stability system